MGVPGLVISHPPHGEVDTRRAAPLLGLHPVDLGLKTHYGIPEIWLAPPDRSQADQVARELGATGLHLAVASGEALRDLPPQALVEDVAFGDCDLAMVVDDTEVALPYDLPAVAVLCTPREEKPAPSEEWGASGSFLDLYVWLEDGLRRFGVVQGITDCSSLAGAEHLSAAGRLLKCAAELEGRFQGAGVDRRLTHLQLRRRLSGTPLAQQRKGYSFASPALDDLLRSIGPGLEHISQCELSSRLVYLTRRGEPSRKSEG